MLHARWSGRVNPLVPAAGVLTGLAGVALGHRPIGIGIAIGALLAFVNGLLLSRRVDLAADMSDMGHALLVMQVGLLVACTIIGIVTVVLVHFSVATAVACGAGFAVTHLATLGIFYWTHARSYAPVEGEAS